jgi:2-phospho-L-lactate guanylyltransferase
MVARAVEGMRGGRGGLVVLAPDRAGAGTNALLVRPPQALPFAFGPQSCARHVDLARERDLEVMFYRAPGTAFDVDRPEDLAELRVAGLWPPTGLHEAHTPTGRAHDDHDA